MVKFRGSKKNKKHLEEVKIQRRNSIIAVLIGLLFLMSIFGITLRSLGSGQSLKIGSFTFISKSTDNGHKLFEISKAKDKSLVGTDFYYLPNEEFKGIFSPSSDEIYNLIINSTFLYISLDPSLRNGTDEEKYALQIHSLSRSMLLKTLNKKKILAFSSVETPYINSTEFGCLNATKSNVVINYVDETNTTNSQGIYINEENHNCIQVISDYQNMIMYNDMLRFLILSENE